jgi:hypothetical protein
VTLGVEGEESMAEHTNQIVPVFDFSEALKLNPEERCEESVRRVLNRIKLLDIADLVDAPMVPSNGATEEELNQLESELGHPLPGEYRDFLARWRYLYIDDFMKISGFDHEGLYVVDRPWFSQEHRHGVPYLVFGDYGAYADGDQLLFDLSDEDRQVVAYLHEHGPLYESFAPSFSLALWRIVNEVEALDKEDG